MPNTPQTRRVPYSTLTYDSSVARYRGPSGRFLDPQSIRRTLDADIDATRGRIEALAKRAQSGELTVAGWRDLHAREVKGLHLAYLAAGKGGFHALDQADFGRAGQNVREQYGFLNARAQKAAADPDYLASDRFLSDVAMYAESGRQTFESQRLVEEQKAGFLFEQNILEDSAHHCTPKGGKPSCEQQSELGVVEVGTLLMPGKRACGPRCRCVIKRTKTKGALAT